MTSLYIHIPFCLHKCAYCDFVSSVCSEDIRSDYADALCREIVLLSHEYKDRMIGTIFIGGGTPSCMPYGDILRIMQTVRRHFDTTRCSEITIECNPGTVDERKLTEYAQCGINRISFGLQSINNRLLRTIERIHSYEDFLRSMEMAKSFGFDNINADIMYGLPGQSTDDFVQTLNAVIKLGLAHISAYSLILEESTPLYDMVHSGKLKLPDEDEEYAMHRSAVELLQRSGYHRYEISNYSKPGSECRHNLVYWNVDEYIGAGVNSHSCVFTDDMQIRYENYANIASYKSSVGKGCLPISSKQIIQGMEQMTEYVMLGTRKTNGFSLEEFRRRFNVDFTDAFGEKLSGIDKRLYVTDDHFYLTDAGLDIQNSVLCDLL